MLKLIRRLIRHEHSYVHFQTIRIYDMRANLIIEFRNLRCEDPKCGDISIGWENIGGREEEISHNEQEIKI